MRSLIFGLALSWAVSSAGIEPVVIPGPDSPRTILPSALTPDGKVLVGSYSRSGGDPIPFRWTDEKGLETLTFGGGARPSPNEYGYASDVSDDGRYIGGMISQNGLKYVIWRDGELVAQRDDRTFFDVIDGLELAYDGSKALLPSAVDGWAIWSPWTPFGGQTLTNPFPAWTSRVLMSKDGTTVFFVKPDGQLARWTAASTEAWAVPGRAGGEVAPLACSRDGRRAYVRVGTHTNVFLWTTEDGLTESRIRMPEFITLPSGVFLTSDDRFVLSRWESVVHTASGLPLGSLTYWVGTGFALKDGGGRVHASIREVGAVAGRGPYHVALGGRDGGPIILLRGLDFGPGDPSPPAGEKWIPDPAFTSPSLFVDAPARHVVRDARGGLLWSSSDGSFGVGANDEYLGDVVRSLEDGSLDSGFRVGDGVVGAWALAPEATGAVLAAVHRRGDLATNGATNIRVVRFGPDGRMDPSYRSPVLTNGVRFMALDRRGRLVIPDQSASLAPLLVGNGGVGGTIRLETNGVLDSGFHSVVVNSAVPGGATPGYWATPAFDSSGRIYLAGLFEGVDGQRTTNVVRLQENGHVDATFVPRGFSFAWGARGIVRAIAVQSDGRVLVGGRAMRVDNRSEEIGLLRLMPDGDLDPTFAPVEGTRFLFVLLDSQERVLASDGTTPSRPAVVRFLTDGRLDPSFEGPSAVGPAVFNGLAVGTGDDVFLPNNQAAHQFPGVSPVSPTRVDASGRVDVGWRGPRRMGLALLRGMQVNPDGGLRVWGEIHRAAGKDVSSLVLVDDAGGVIPEAMNAAVPKGRIEVSAAPSRDGSLYVLAGDAYLSTNSVGLSLGRLGTDGRPDPGFQPPTLLFPPGARLSDYAVSTVEGDVLLVRNRVQDVVDGAPWMRRLDRQGKVTETYPGTRRQAGRVVYMGTDLVRVDVGWFGVLCEMGEGRHVVGWSGDDGEMNLFRLGILGRHGDLEAVMGVTATASDITVTGYWEVSNPRTGTVVQVESREAPPQLPPPFGGVVVRPDGSLLVFGGFTELNGRQVGGLARLTADGQLDLGFGTMGKGARWAPSPNESPRVDAVLPTTDGRLWVAGRFDSFSGVPAPGLVRLLADGEVDATFSSPIEYRDHGGRHRTSLLHGRDGTLWIAGTYSSPGGTWPRLVHGLRREAGEPTGRIAITRGDGDLRIDFDGRIETAPSVIGPWTPLNNVVSPYRFRGEGSPRFFRSRW